MKKIVCAMLCILLVFSLSACGGNVNEVNTHNVESEVYSEEDIATAIDTIKKEFKSNWNGCTLTEIYYAGDDNSTKRFLKRILSRGSNPAVGSSTTRMRGRFSKVCAIPIRCFIPPEKPPIFLSLFSYI